jgi:hypothetical protein
LLINKTEKKEQILLDKCQFSVKLSTYCGQPVEHQYGVVNERGDHSWKRIKQKIEEDSTNASHN